MLKKKISSKDWTEIGKYNYAAKWIRPLCSYRLIKESDGSFKREQSIGWFIYLVLFIPVHLLQALWCMWDGGLVEFEINKRHLGVDYLIQGSESWSRAEKVWNNKNK